MQYIYRIYITTADAWVIVERGGGDICTNRANILSAPLTLVTAQSLNS